MSKRELIILATAAALGLAVRLCLPRIEAPPRHAISANTDQPDIAAALRSLSPAAGPTKPWVTDPDQFARDNPGSWVIGKSSSPCLTEAQAAKEAHDDAMRQVSADLSNTLDGYGRDADWIGSKVMADVEAGKLEVDRAAEPFVRPYGTIWTESVLLDVSQQRLGQLIHRYTQELAAHRRHVAWLRGGAAIMAGSGWAAYWVLNIVTLGYFTTRLRLAATAMTVAAIVLIL